MYKLEVKLEEGYFGDKEIVTIESFDFDKIQIIQEFIEFQQEYGWAADYQLSDEFVDAQCDEEEVTEDDELADFEVYEGEIEEIEEDEEYEEYEIGEIVEDEDGLIWKRVA